MPAFNQSRQSFIRILFLVSFIVLILRLLFLQLGSRKYDLLALDNAVSKKIIYPDRGIIFDRNGLITIRLEIFFARFKEIPK